MIVKMLTTVGAPTYCGGTPIRPAQEANLSSLNPLRFVVITVFIAVMVACSGSTPKNVILQPAISAAISPTSSTLPAGGTQSFSATVQNATDTNVTWYVNQVNGGSSATGIITSTGLYTAPSVQSQTTFTVTTVADADTSISASASVTVTPLVNVTLNPHNAAVETSHTLQFSVTVVNTPNTAVTWQVNGVTGGNSTVGTINANGLYTAPNTVPAPPKVTVTAISVADPTKSDSASVTISVTPVLTVNPPQAIVVVGNQQPFTATISGPSNQSVNWSLSGTGCSGAQCGTIDSGGLYTAPPSVPSPAATVTVTATSQVDNSVTGSATVTVIAHLGVSISPPGTQLSPVHVALGGTQSFSAPVVGDTNGLGVTWDLVCVSDAETTQPLDCAFGKGSSDGGTTTDISSLTGSNIFSTTFQAAVGDEYTTSCDEGATCILTLTATTIATENGTPATAVVYISVP
jgi:hypothetical protein